MDTINKRVSIRLDAVHSNTKTIWAEVTIKDDWTGERRKIIRVLTGTCIERLADKDAYVVGHTITGFQCDGEDNFIEISEFYAREKKSFLLHVGETLDIFIKKTITVEFIGINKKNAPQVENRHAKICKAVKEVI